MSTENIPIQPSLLDQILAGTLAKVADNEQFSSEHVDSIRGLIDVRTLTQDRLIAALTIDQKDGGNEDH